RIRLPRDTAGDMTQWRYRSLRPQSPLAPQRNRFLPHSPTAFRGEPITARRIPTSHLAAFFDARRAPRWSVGGAEGNQVVTALREQWSRSGLISSRLRMRWEFPTDGARDIAELTECSGGPVREER